MSVKSIVRSLTKSDIIAFRRLLEIMGDKNEISIVIGEAVEGTNISRSAFGAMLSKLRFAGVIESRSCGRNGVYIRILDRDVIDVVVNVIDTIY